MAGSVNKVILVGHLGRDPEIRSVGRSDERVANFSIATSESWRDKQSGDRREKTEWHNVVVWNPHLVKIVESYIKKGSLVYIEGSLQTRKWMDKDGVDRYTTEVVLSKFRGELTMLGSPKEGDQNRRETGYGADDYSSGFSTGGASRTSAPKDSYDLNDDIPF